MPHYDFFDIFRACKEQKMTYQKETMQKSCEALNRVVLIPELEHKVDCRLVQFFT